jgi:hypothetical protein
VGIGQARHRPIPAGIGLYSRKNFKLTHYRQRAIVDIGTLAVLEGRLSPRALGLVTEWAALHQGELLDAWERARRQEPLPRIAPLE